MMSRVAICFLVVNKMGVLPELAITSAFDRTGLDILVGCLDDEDLPCLRSDLLFKTIRLESPLDLNMNQSENLYKDFSEDAFYQIVQLKWQLLERVLGMGYDYVLYSDTDVYWNENPVNELIRLFDLRNEVAVQIQSFSDYASIPQLCMGFVALRNSPVTHKFIQECKSRHAEHSRNLGRIGDDDIVTQYYLENNFPRFIQELPQTTFPVGRFLNLYSGKAKYPGLPSPRPFIFHANYVVGLRNKILLMKLFIINYSSYDRDMKLGLDLHFRLVLQRCRLKLSLLRRRLFD